MSSESEKSPTENPTAERRSRRPDLRCVWSKRERDFVYHYDRKPNSHWLHCLLHGAMHQGIPPEERASLFGSTNVAMFRRELERRGYDPDTFTISVRRKATPRKVLDAEGGDNG